ncbi:hypothetical protein DFH27DRAFT_652157 [Peziza echinospora]|nr:hypothetical protein DFH27DRAFT_652157 [Peziza echinospora]
MTHSPTSPPPKTSWTPFSISPPSATTPTLTLHLLAYVKSCHKYTAHDLSTLQIRSANLRHIRDINAHSLSRSHTHTSRKYNLQLRPSLPPRIPRPNLHPRIPRGPPIRSTPSTQATQHSHSPNLARTQEQGGIPREIPRGFPRLNTRSYKQRVRHSFGLATSRSNPNSETREKNCSGPPPPPSHSPINLRGVLRRCTTESTFRGLLNTVSTPRSTTVLESRDRPRNLAQALCDVASSGSLEVNSLGRQQTSPTAGSAGLAYAVANEQAEMVRSGISLRGQRLGKCRIVRLPASEILSELIVEIVGPFERGGDGDEG